MTNQKQPRYDEGGYVLVDGPEDIPEFQTDEEEATFWDTHTFSDQFWERGRHLNPDEVNKLASHYRQRVGHSER